MIAQWPRLIEARPGADYRVGLRFADGAGGQADLSGGIRGELLAPLREPGKFRRLKVHQELQTLVRPNGADLAPEHIYSLVRRG